MSFIGDCFVASRFRIAQSQCLDLSNTNSAQNKVWFAFDHTFALHDNWYQVSHTRLYCTYLPVAARARLDLGDDDADDARVECRGERIELPTAGDVFIPLVGVTGGGKPSLRSLKEHTHDIAKAVYQSQSDSHNFVT